MSDLVIAKLRAILDDRNLDGMLISGATNRRYASGYTADDHAPDESSGVLLIGRDSARLFASPNNTDWAASEADGVEVEPWKRPWEPFIAGLAKEIGWTKIGFEDRALPVASLEAMRSEQPSLTWTPLAGSIDHLRAVKTDAEIAHLEEAIRLTDDVFAKVAAALEPGITEKHVVWQIERLTRETTSGTVAFSPGVGGGPHSAHPHHAATNRPFQVGEPIVIDMGVASNGYCGDLTRTLWFGEAPERLREVYNVVYRANAEATKAISAGVRAKDVDQLARDIITSAGFGDYLVHSLGHRVGLRIHEAPSLSIASDEVLQPGHVVTVEPGIYIPAWGGVRIEDVVLVTEQGCRVLTGAEKHAGWDA